MKKIFILISLITFALTACDHKDESTDPKPEQLFEKAYKEVSTAYSTAAGSRSYNGSINYSNSLGTLVVTGTSSYNLNTGIIAIDLLIKFINFTTQDGTIIDGSTSFDLDITSATSTIKYNGSFTMKYQGKTYPFTWNITAAVANNKATFTGTYTVNGVSYTYTGSLAYQ